MAGKTTPVAQDAHVKRFSRWADTYERSLIQRLYFGPIQARMLRFLEQTGPTEPPHCIVDVGCGTGRLLRAVAVRWPQAQLAGIDPAAGMIAQARRLTPQAMFALAAAEALPFADGSVDLVLSSLSLHHWADPQQGLYEVARILRPGGCLCLADQTAFVAKVLGQRITTLQQLQDLYAAAGLTLRRHLRLHTRFVLITLAEK